MFFITFNISNTTRYPLRVKRPQGLVIIKNKGRGYQWSTGTFCEISINYFIKINLHSCFSILLAPCSSWLLLAAPDSRSAAVRPPCRPPVVGIILSFLSWNSIKWFIKQRRIKSQRKLIIIIINLLQDWLENK